jgi:hypothetical protein
MGLALTFSDGKVHGTGTDVIGPFWLSGSFDDQGSVHMTKSYSWHVVDYKGKWDGQMISGSWKIKYEGSGAFEIWPESDSFAVSEMFESEVHEMAGT